MATINISITDLMREQIDARVASGMYANASDYMRDLIRHDMTEAFALDWNEPEISALLSRSDEDKDKESAESS